MREFIKTYISGIAFAIMVLHGLCYLMFFFFKEDYLKISILAEHFTNCSAVSIIFLYVISEDAGYVAKRSVMSLAMVWVSNLVAIIFGIKEILYFYICISLIYMFFFGTIINYICKNLFPKRALR